MDAIELVSRTKRRLAAMLVSLAALAALSACSAGTPHGQLPPGQHTAQLPTPQSISPGLIAPAPMAKTTLLPPDAMRSEHPISTKGAVQGMSYSAIPGAASFAAAAPDGSLWVLSTQPAGADKYIWHYAGGAWANISGLASRITVAPNGTLYAINSGGGAYAYSGGTWTAFGGGCRDLTAAADGSLYVISNGGGADGAIWHYASGGWTQAPGSGNRLAASSDPGTYGGITPGGFFVVNSAGAMYYLGASGYVELPGAASAIAPSRGGLFVLGAPASTGGNAVYYYNLNTGNWTAQAGSGISLSATASDLYIISASGGIYTSAVTDQSEADLMARFPFAASTGQATVGSDISPAWTSDHVSHLNLVFNYFSSVFSKSYGGRSNIFYTNDTRLMQRVVNLCGGSVGSVKGQRVVNSCYDPVAGVQSLYILPYTYPGPDFGTQQHEISHQFLYATWPPAEQNVWFKEGLGMYYESGSFSGTSLVMTVPNQYITQNFKKFAAAGQLIPLSTLLNWDRATFYGQPDPTQTYSQAGMFVFDLMKQHPSTMTKVFAALNKGTAGLADNAALLNLITSDTGESLSQLDAEYTAFGNAQP